MICSLKLLVTLITHVIKFLSPLLGFSFWLEIGQTTRGKTCPLQESCNTKIHAWNWKCACRFLLRVMSDFCASQKLGFWWLTLPHVIVSLTQNFNTIYWIVTVFNLYQKEKKKFNYFITDLAPGYFLGHQVDYVLVNLHVKVASWINKPTLDHDTPKWALHVGWNEPALAHSTA